MSSRFAAAIFRRDSEVVFLTEKLPGDAHVRDLRRPEFIIQVLTSAAEVLLKGQASAERCGRSE